VFHILQVYRVRGFHILQVYRVLGFHILQVCRVQGSHTLLLAGMVLVFHKLVAGMVLEFHMQAVDMVRVFHMLELLWFPCTQLVCRLRGHLFPYTHWCSFHTHPLIFNLVIVQRSLRLYKSN
jgi:hypothetical protein